MKKIIRTLTVFIALSLTCAIFPKQVSAQHSYVSFQLFYDELGPYGSWVAYPHYGYVWVPDAGPDFVPYATDGHWVFTDYGWTWVSDYSWGWAPFHYGRWDYDNYYGWFWVPDKEWGPAWVVWRRAHGYCGWAPMKPGITVNFVYGRGYDIPHEHWIFVRDDDFERDRIMHYRIHRSENVVMIHKSEIIHDTYIDKDRHTSYFAGPDRHEIERNTGKPVRRVAVHPVNTPERRTVSNKEVEIYRPMVQKQDVPEQKNRPNPVERWQKRSTSNNSDQSHNRSQNQVNKENRTQQSQQNNIKPADNRTERKTENANPSNKSKSKEQPVQSGATHRRR